MKLKRKKVSTDSALTASVAVSTQKRATNAPLKAT